MNIAVLLSGGVDSSVATHLLCEQGYKPDLFYIRISPDRDNKLTCSAEEDIEMSQSIARKYGLNFEIVDLHKQYWDNVVTYVIEKVKAGLTPNPDVMCNKLIKFGCFEQQIGCHYDKTATGHYATTKWQNEKIWLGTAKDKRKDQTDFLAQIDYIQISHLLFPIGNYTKEEIRNIARTEKLPNAKRKDSQGICFLGKINYNDFIRYFLGTKEGPVIEQETGKKIGTHQGYWFHTIGQRKGLGISNGPWFVIKKDIEENSIYVSRGYNTEKQYGNEFSLQNFHFITANPWLNTSEVKIKFKIRHVEQFLPGTLYPDKKLFNIKSPEKIQGIAPGQFGVIYDEKEEICIGSGEIS